MNEQIKDLILNMDWMDAFKNIPEKSIDLVVTDPPYYIENLQENLKGDTLRQSNKNNIFHADWDSTWKSLSEFKIWIKKLLIQLNRVMKNKAQCYMFMSYHHLDWIITMIKELNFTWYKPLIWYKPDTMGVFPNQYGCNYEVILWFRKNDGSENGTYINNIGNSQRDVFTYLSTGQKARKDAGFHPTAKPKPLIRQLILNGSNEGNLILDCFGGSGTTAICCKETNRKYLVIEKEKKYYDIIIKRLSQQGIRQFITDFK